MDVQRSSHKRMKLQSTLDEVVCQEFAGLYRAGRVNIMKSKGMHKEMGAATALTGPNAPAVVL